MLKGRPLIPWLVKAVLVAITVGLIAVVAYSRDDQFEAVVVMQSTSDPPADGLLPEVASTTRIGADQTVQRMPEATKPGSSDPIPSSIHSDGLCLTSGQIGVAPGDAWTLVGTTEVTESGGEEVASKTVTTFVVNRIDDAQWLVDGRQVLARGSKVAIRSSTWTKSNEVSIDGPVEEDLVFPIVRVTDLSPVLTLDWECHKQAWLDGWVATEGPGGMRSEPSLEETTLDSGLRVVRFSVTQASEQSSDGSMQTLESSFGYDKWTGRLVLSEIRMHGTTVRGPVNTETNQVLSPQSPVAIMTSRAPLESVAIEEYWADSSGGWSLTVVSGLPNSCWSLVDDVESLTSDSIQLEINNVLNIRPDMDCNQMYRTVTTKIPITRIEACKIYTANVNAAAYAVQAIGRNVGCDVPIPKLGQEHVLAFGGTVRFESEGLRVGFMDLQEDSRCPSDVTCIQAGQATILMDTAHDASRLLGGLTVTLDTDREIASERFQGYTITLISLDPYPISTQETKLQDYVATVVVTK